MKKIILTSYLLFFAALLVPYQTQLARAADMPNLTNPMEKLQVPLPSGYMQKRGIDCDEKNADGKIESCRVPYLADYIAGWFKYAVGIGALLGVITAMIGGFLWIISAGNAQKIGEAKKWITNGLIGIVLLATSYIILYQVNPELTKLKPITLSYINKEDGGDTDTPTTDMTSAPAAISCPKSGGTGAIPGIVQSFNGKVTYRFGGKGGPAPYNYDTKICDDKPCKEFCPSGTICLDCSGFVGQILKCAGLGGVSGGTASIFSGAESISSLTDTTANGVALKPGDLLGNPTSGKHIGHVYIYVGGGRVAESRGSGRTPGGTAMNLSNTSSNKSKMTYIKRQ